MEGQVYRDYLLTKRLRAEQKKGDKSSCEEYIKIDNGELKMHNKGFKFNNGEKVEDRISGFTGTVTCMCCYITGCNRCQVEAFVKDKITKAVTRCYDEERLQRIK